MTDFVYLIIKDSSGRWFNQGAFTAEGFNTVYDEAVSIYGEGNVQATYDSKGADKLNRTRMVGQLKGIGQKFTAGLGQVKETYDKYAEETREQRARPLMRPPAPHRPSVGMMPNPSEYAKMERPPPDTSKTKYGRPKRGVNIFRDSRYTASYLSQQQRDAMNYRRRRRW